MTNTNILKLFLIVLVVVLANSDVGAQAVQEKPQTQEKQGSKEPESSEQGDSEQQDQKQDESDKDPDDPEERRKQRTERSRLRRIKKYQNTKQAESFVKVFSTVVADTRNSVVELVDGSKQIALGAIVDESGLVLTKASELKGSLKCVLSNGNSVEPKVIGVDPDTDLILLKIDRQGLPAVQFTEKSSTPAVGSWIATVSHEENPVAVGIVSHQPRKIVPNSAIIGILPVDVEGTGVRINRIFADSPASKSDLLVNDVIVAIDEDKMENMLQLRDKLSNFQPGDEITLTIMRGEEKKVVPIILGKRRVSPMFDRGSRQNRLGSTLSKRRNNFPLALQQDASLNANQCGGPVVDLDGKVVGFNIARDGRVSTLVLTNEIVLPVIAKLKSGKFTPMVVNKEAIKKIEKRIANIKNEIGELPKEKQEKEIEFSAGAAIEDEIQKQIDEFEAKLKTLKKRHRDQKKTNRAVLDSKKEIQRKLEQIENDRERMEFDLKRLKTGVR